MDSRADVQRSGHLALLGRFALVVDNAEIAVGETSQRLMALVALQPGPVSRERVAESLWPDEPHERTRARLRTGLSRLKRDVPWIVTSTTTTIGLSTDVAVDYPRVCALGRRLVEQGVSAEPDDVDLHSFDCDLLPDWYDDWLVAEREAFRQLRFAALEVIASTALRSGQPARATQACLAVIRAEPLRESAYRLLARAHAAEGNVGEALRQMDSYANLLKGELGVCPSPQMIDLRDHLVSSLEPGKW